MTPRIRVLGRIHDALRQNDTWVTSSQIADLVLGSGEIEAFQLVEKSDGSLVLSVVGSDASNLTEELQELIGNEVDIKFRKVNSLRAEPGGKFRWVKPNKRADSATTSFTT